MKPYQIVFLAAVCVCAPLAATAVLAEAVTLPEAPGKADTLASCTACHGVDLIVAQRRSPDEWSQVVSRMVGNGASLSDEQYQSVLAYLTTNLANTPAPDPAPSGK